MARHRRVRPPRHPQSGDQEVSRVHRKKYPAGYATFVRQVAIAWGCTMKDTDRKVRTLLSLINRRVVTESGPPVRVPKLGTFFLSGRQGGPRTVPGRRGVYQSPATRRLAFRASKRIIEGAWF